YCRTRADAHRRAPRSPTGQVTTRRSTEIADWKISVVAPCSSPASISPTTVSGTTTSTPPSRKKSSRPVFVSRISGDVLTMRRDGTVDLLHEFIDCHLIGRDLCPEEFVQELGPAQACDQGTLTLGDPALAVELDRGRQPEFPRSRLGRGCQRLQDALGQ